MRIIFAGTPETAVPSLYRLAEHHEIVAVLTRAPARVGRKGIMQKSSIHIAAESLNIPVMTPTTLRDLDIQHAIASYTPDVVAVVAYGLLVPPALLDVPKHGWLNLHFSLLPRWRGAAPVQHALQAGDAETGVSVFRLDTGLDTGPVAMQKVVRVQENINSGDLLADLAVLGADVLSDVFDHLDSGTVTFRPQEGNITYAPQLESSMAEIDWSEPVRTVHNFVRALFPEPGAWSTLGGIRIKIVETACVPDNDLQHIASISATKDTSNRREVVPGTIISTKKRAYVQTGSGLLELVTVWPAGKKQMRGADWVRGLRSEDIPSFEYTGKNTRL